MARNKGSNGHDLLASFDAAVSAHRQDAEFRCESVTGRINELEAELASLRKLQFKLEAASN